MPIKWRPQDLKKLSSYVRKFNTAITNLEKKSPELKDSGVLPERLTTKELRQRIINRNDFNREIRKIDRFFKPNARDIVVDASGSFTTKWQAKELKLLERRINAQRKKFVKEFSVSKENQKFLGIQQIDLEKEKQKITKRAMNDDDPENTMQEWYNLIYTLERESSGEYLTSKFAELRNAYFKAIREHLPKDKADELIQYLKDNDVWGSDIIWAISQNDILDFDYFYSTDEEEARAEVMIDRWKGLMPKLKQTEGYKSKKKK